MLSEVSVVLKSVALANCWERRPYVSWSELPPFAGETFSNKASISRSSSASSS